MFLERACLKMLFLGQSQLSHDSIKDVIGIHHDFRRVAHGSERVLKNSGWCNISGQQIYWGDVSEGDIETLITRSPEPIIFIPEGRSASFMQALREPDKQFSIDYVLDDPNGLVLPTLRQNPGAFFRFFKGETSTIERLQIDRETREIKGAGTNLRGDEDYSFAFYKAEKTQIDRILLADFIFGKRHYKETLQKY